MITVQTETLILLLLAAALAGALIAVLPAWRRLAGQGLPVRSFFARRGVGVEGAAELQAEIRCALCETQARCRHLLAAGAETPPEGCPNAALFAKEAPSSLAPQPTAARGRAA